MTNVRIDVLKRKDGWDDSYRLGTVEVPPFRLNDALEQIKALWPKFLESDPECEDDFVQWLVDQKPDLFLQEAVGNHSVFVS